MIQLPQVDLNTLFPVAGLAAIAVVCIIALLLAALLRSRIALVIAIVVGVVAAGPSLAGALRDIVLALVPLVAILIAGVIVVLWLLPRHPDLLDLVRDIVSRHQKIPPAHMPAALESPASRAIVEQRQVVPRQAARSVQNVNEVNGDRWGF